MAFGGIPTLGMQVDPTFVEVNIHDAFVVQDSHVRFLGGLLTVTGLFFLIGVFWFVQLRNVLIALLLMVAGAGLFRLVGGEANLLSSDILSSLIAELVYAPILAYMIWRTAEGE